MPDRIISDRTLDVVIAAMESHDDTAIENAVEMLMEVKRDPKAVVRGDIKQKDK